MKIDQAIEILAYLSTAGAPNLTLDEIDATELGREALKYYQAIKIHDPKYKASCLPGETD